MGKEKFERIWPLGAVWCGRPCGNRCAHKPRGFQIPFFVKLLFPFLLFSYISLPFHIRPRGHCYMVTSRCCFLSCLRECFHPCLLSAAHFLRVTERAALTGLLSLFNRIATTYCAQSVKKVLPLPKLWANKILGGVFQCLQPIVCLHI